MPKPFKPKINCAFKSQLVAQYRFNEIPMPTANRDKLHATLALGDAAFTWVPRHLENQIKVNPFGLKPATLDHLRAILRDAEEKKVQWIAFVDDFLTS